VRLGDPSTQRISIDLAVFEKNDIFLDCRGHLRIEPNTRWGYGVKVITATHNQDLMRDERPFPEMVKREVWVKRLAWIASFSLLYNCEIGIGALIGCGAVVKGVVVPAWRWVEGNPAMIVGSYDQAREKWVRGTAYDLPRKRGITRKQWDPEWGGK
jgi:acetyltransferase-like isoleucine patch superfamily enzyme